MAVSRKAMTEGIRTFLFPGTPCERNLTIPQSKIRDFCQLPLHKGAEVLPHQCFFRWRSQWLGLPIASEISHLGIVIVSTIWLSVSRRSDTAGIPDS